MRQAIVTKYLGPSNHRGARVKATAQAGSITLPWDDARDVDENHAASVMALAAKYNWGTAWIGGGSPDGTSYVWVCTDRG